MKLFVVYSTTRTMIHSFLCQYMVLKILVPCDARQLELSKLSVHMSFTSEYLFLSSWLRPLLTISRYIRRGTPDAGFPLFETESLKWPGFVEFDDVNGKVLTYSAQDRYFNLCNDLFLKMDEFFLNLMKFFWIGWTNFEFDEYCFNSITKCWIFIKKIWRTKMDSTNLF